MKLTIRPLNMRMTRAVALFVEARVRGALGRVAAGAEAIRVTLQRNAQPGAELKGCNIQVTLPGLPPIVARATDRDLYAAISSACLRAGAVARRAESRRRQRMTAEPPRLLSRAG
ncbi:HPF/RaiA family ribosome-associated protein [Ectothiorhodospiraceae bacterium WFHF3C12]|nr:HPF/RaiA family ribosome-associated protein [Ectothiorhodospiraceae bacterium WFHF3C12]